MSLTKPLGVGLMVLALLYSGTSTVIAQPAPAGDPGHSSGPEVWDANHDGIYTCAEWKSYLDRIFTLADRNHDGRIDRPEFETVRKVAVPLADADFDYFDENQDGKITRSEFVDKPSQFILRFDKNGDCRVTPDELKSAAKPQNAPNQPVRDRWH